MYCWALFLPPFLSWKQFSIGRDRNSSRRCHCSLWWWRLTNLNITDTSRAHPKHPPSKVLSFYGAAVNIWIFKRLLLSLRAREMIRTSTQCRQTPWLLLFLAPFSRWMENIRWHGVCLPWAHLGVPALLCTRVWEWRWSKGSLSPGKEPRWQQRSGRHCKLVLSLGQLQDPFFRLLCFYFQINKYPNIIILGTENLPEGKEAPLDSGGTSGHLLPPLLHMTHVQWVQGPLMIAAKPRWTCIEASQVFFFQPRIKTTTSKTCWQKPSCLFS